MIKVTEQHAWKWPLPEREGTNQEAAVAVSAWDRSQGSVSAWDRSQGSVSATEGVWEREHANEIYEVFFPQCTPHEEFLKKLG